MVTLFVVSLLAFYLSKAAPGDPVAQQMAEMESAATNADRRAAQRSYAAAIVERHLHEPTFYLSVHPATHSRALDSIVRLDVRAAMTDMAEACACGGAVTNYYRHIEQFREATAALPDTLAQYDKWMQAGDALLLESRRQEARRTVSDLRKQTRDTRLEFVVRDLERAADLVAYHSHPKTLLRYIPTIYYHGTANQYHRWWTALLRGDLGRSYADGRPVTDKIADALPITLLLDAVSLVLIFVLGIPIGVYLTLARPGRQWVSGGLFLLYAIPTFWLATLCVVFLTHPEYGMDWFPAGGTGAGKSLLGQAWHYVLPVFCLTYGSLAYVARQMQQGMQLEWARDYVRAARARGFTRRRVLWGHAFRNAVFPMITIAAQAFGGLLSGAVVVEYVFNLPGIGRLMLFAIQAQDWPTLFGILMLTAVMTIVGNLLGDLAYKYANPLVRLG